jgi:hypothetical protein
MKRIAAIAALTVALGAIPATAMASTGSTKPAPGPVQTPVPVAVRCLPPGATARPPVIVKAPPGTVKPVKVKQVVVACCGQIRRGTKPGTKPGTKLAARVCLSQVVVFDMAAGSSVVTEVRGPRLHRGERLLYQQEVYTVESVWGRTFDVDRQGHLVVNTGPAIDRGIALVIGPNAVVVKFSPAPPPGH